MNLLQSVGAKNASRVGFVASSCITLMSLVRGWPFPPTNAAPWFVELVATRALVRYGALMVFLVALGALSWAWLQVMMASHAGKLSERDVWRTFLLWTFPLVFSTPLCSGDVYVYYTDGQAVLRGYDLYQVGISSLGVDPIVNIVHPLWRDTNTMYGPLFMKLAGVVAAVSPNSIIGGVLLHRLIAIVSVVLTGLALSVIARKCARPVAAGIAFVLLNPVTLIHLVSGSHNDAVMVALVSIGCAFGLFVTGMNIRSVFFGILALVCCSLSGAFKIPGFAGVFVLGWLWAGQRASFLRRLAFVTLSGAVGIFVFALQTWVSGMGWGWFNASKVPGLAHPLLAPANAVGVAIGNTFDLNPSANAVSRGVATAIAVVLAVALVVRTHRDAKPDRVIRAFGWALLGLAMLGPAVYPWYFVWGAAIAGVMGLGSVQRSLEWMLALIVFFVLPGGYGVLDIPKGALRTWTAWVVVAVMSLGLMHLLRRVALIERAQKQWRDIWRVGLRNRRFRVSQ